MSSTTEKINTFTVTLTPEAYRIAERRRQSFDQPKKAQQIYLNTLALYAVSFYCQCMGIETSWQNSNFFDPICITLLDVTDIELVGLGKLECRPVLPGQVNCFIPAELWEPRIGYVAVEVDNSTKEATLLGFYPSLSTLGKMVEYVSLDLFHSIDYMLDHLLHLELGLEFLNSNDPVALKVREKLVDIPHQEIVIKFEQSYRASSEKGSKLTSNSLSQLSKSLADELIEKLGKIWKPKDWINLSKWLLSSSLNNDSSLLENGYLTVVEYLQRFNNPNLKLASTLGHRTQLSNPVSLSVVKQFKLGDCKLVLNVGAEVKGESRRDIVVRVCMDAERSCSLPEGLQLIVVDEIGNEVLGTEAKRSDNMIAVEFRADLGDQFGLQLVLNQHSFTENYIFS